MEKVYICIDLKSFYASVECRKRNLDPLKTNLVVADESRTLKTICLAVSPSLKQYKIAGRCRLFEVIKRVREINYERQKHAYRNFFSGKSCNDDELRNNRNLELDFIIAKPRMAEYIKYSTDIYNIYLKYLSKDDIYVYSIDEVFCDITNYLKLYSETPEGLVTKMIKDVYEKTGITATAGIGSNLYLCKIAMDIMAKKSKPNEFGVRIATLNTKSYRKLLWNHQPITDFWRVGKGTANRLYKFNIKTMGDIALTSISNEALLYKLFGINAELLIDHAWGYEPVTMHDIKNYKPEHNSISTGQVLHCAYDFDKAILVVREMSELLSLELTKKGLATSKIVLTIGYDTENVKNPKYSRYLTDIAIDQYGRTIPKVAHSTINLKYHTSSTKIISDSVCELYKKITNPKLLIKRINMAACFLTKETHNHQYLKQFSLFENQDEAYNAQIKEQKNLEDDLKVQRVLLSIKNKYGKNAILKGMDLSDGATTIDRNNLIGGHHE